MNVIPAFSSHGAPNSREVYERYLQSASWRVTRNAALRRARWRCERCDSARDLHVHHKTYERLGREWDQDVEVVCGGCHKSIHVQQMEQSDHGRTYLKIVTEIYRGSPFANVSDLAEAVKVRCAKLHVPYSNHQVDRAIGLLLGTERIVFLKAAPAVEPSKPEPPLIERPEAYRLFREVVERVNANGGAIKVMPSVRGQIDIYGPLPYDEVEHDRY